MASEARVWIGRLTSGFGQPRGTSGRSTWLSRAPWGKSAACPPAAHVATLGLTRALLAQGRPPARLARCKGRARTCGGSGEPGQNPDSLPLSLSRLSEESANFLGKLAGSTGLEPLDGNFSNMVMARDFWSQRVEAQSLNRGCFVLCGAREFSRFHPGRGDILETGNGGG